MLHISYYVLFYCSWGRLTLTYLLLHLVLLQVGTFDPYSDDPRLALQKVLLCPLSETLVVGGTAGQVAVFQLERVQRQLTISVTPTNIVKDHDNFVWKGHESLPVRGGEIDFAAGFQPVSVMQLYPPAACTALALHSEWQL